MVHFPRLRLRRPRPHRRAVRRNLIALTLAILAATAAAELQVQQYNSIYSGGPLHALETTAQDQVLRGRDPSLFGSSVGRDPRQVITIVAMDEKSIAALGVPPWPRTDHAQLVDNLMQAPPRVIAFDVGFFDPKPQEDAALAAAFQRARSRVPSTAIVIAGAGGGDAARGPDGDIAFTEGLQPIPSLADVADIASANVIPDDEGSVRSMPLLVRMGDTQRPTLGMAAVARYLRRPNFNADRPSPDTLVFAGRRIPVDWSSQVRVNYFGAPFFPGLPSTFREVSYVDVLQGKADPNLWRDGIVFVGLMGATGFADDYWTPVSDLGHKMSGVEIHANVAATLLSTQFLRSAPLPLDLGLILGLAILIGLLSANVGVLLAFASAIVLLALYFVADLSALDQVGLQMALANPILAGALSFIFVTAYRVAIEQRQARALQGALGSVIPPAVAQEIARDPDRVRMGGERRTISVLFTDLKNFTTFSESVAPELLSHVITEYLNAMTAVVFGKGGTVDKFIGDAVLAFWTAPLDDPDHARHACEAALEMQAALARLGDKWEADGLQRQKMRVGINTGPASVGNMGTTQRFAYTALGDTVNLGARLEPLNNEYGTWICISQATLDAAGGRERFLVRFLDLVAVKGKKEPVPVFELIGRMEDTALVEKYRPILEPYHRAMVLYQARDFGQAAEVFHEALAAAGPDGDQPSAVYVERCEDLDRTPPEPDWDGVYVMHHK